MNPALNDIFASTNEMHITSISDTSAVTEMTVSERHLNGVGVCQGGALFTLADLAIAALTNRESKSVSTDADIHFLAPAMPGEHLTCTCRMIRDGRHPFANGEIKCETKLIATFSGRDYKIEKL